MNEAIENSDVLRTAVWAFENKDETNIFAVNTLHRSAIFKSRKKTDVNYILDVLQKVGFTSGSQLVSSGGGRPREVRSVTPEWSDEKPETLEARLIDVMVKLYPQAGCEPEAEAPILHAAPEQEPSVPIVTLAPQPVPVAKPKFGPLRILQSSFIAYGGMLGGTPLQAGEIVTDETLCQLLLRDGFSVARMDELGKVTCPIKGCHFTFDLSDESQKPPEHPILVVLREVRFQHNWVTICLEKGAIVGDPDMVNTILLQGLPQFDTARQSEWAYCTKCKCYFGREHCLGNSQLYELQLAAQAKFNRDAQAQAERIAMILEQNPPSTLPPLPQSKKNAHKFHTLELATES